MHVSAHAYLSARQLLFDELCGLHELNRVGVMIIDTCADDKLTQDDKKPNLGSITIYIN